MLQHLVLSPIAIEISWLIHQKLDTERVQSKVTKCEKSLDTNDDIEGSCEKPSGSYKTLLKVLLETTVH